MSSHTSETSLPENLSEKTDVVRDPEHGLSRDDASAKKEVDDTLPDPFAVTTLSPEENPKNLSGLRKWAIVITICSGALCATCASSMAAFAEAGVSHDLHVGKEVSILGITLFVLGLGLGPLLVGPLSEVHGRNIIYRTSYGLFFAFSWAVAFPPHIAVYLIFRFLTGFCSAAFLSVAGGSVSDLYENDKLATPMAVFTISPFIGPVIGPVAAGFISENTDWRWIFRVIIIWTFLQFILLLALVPETFAPVLLKKKAQKLRKETGDSRYACPLDRRDRTMMQAMMISCYVPFKLLMFDAMALFLDIWSALILGILYLTFQAFPIIFGQVHHFSQEFVGLSFIGLGIGMLGGLSLQPFVNRHMHKLAAQNGGVHPPPEARLIPAMFGGVMIPLSLYWLAFTTYPQVHWIAPIIASVPFGTGIFLCFTSVFTYTVVAYRPIAASAMAANTFVRTSFAAVFPLFAGQMYDRLGTVGATALLAGLTTLFAPLPFIFYRIGARLRAKSRFTHA